MKLLKRNKQEIQYALLDYTENVVDDNGYMTGEKNVIYKKTRTMLVSVSPAKNNLTYELFGVDDKYDVVIISDDKECPIDEYSKVWIDKRLYSVQRVSKSLNFVNIALERLVDENN